MSAVATKVRRPPPWRDVRVLRWVFQAVFLFIVAVLLLYLWETATDNLRRLGIRTDFRYLRRPAGFAIPDSDFRSSQSLFDAVLVGIRNPANVALLGIVLATILGVLVGVARLSTNWLVRRAAAAYVETFRNVPVLILIIFCWLGVFLRLPPISDATEILDLVVVSNRGMVVPWFDKVGSGAVFGIAALAGLVLAAGAWIWRTRRFDRTGEPHHRVRWALGVLVLAFLVGFFAGGRPLAISLPERGDLGVAEGFRFSPEYAALLFGLVLYTASHIAEIVRGSILAVPRGQTEAADAVGLSDFQRLRLV